MFEYGVVLPHPLLHDFNLTAAAALCLTGPKIADVNHFLVAAIASDKDPAFILDALLAFVVASPRFRLGHNYELAKPPA